MVIFSGNLTKRQNMMQVATKPNPGRPRTSFSIDDIVGRPRSRSPRNRSPAASSGSESPRSENERDMTSPRPSLDEVQARLDQFKSKLHGDLSPTNPLKGFQPVIPGIHGLRGLHPSHNHHHELVARVGLSSLPPESLGFLQQHSSHPFLHLQTPPHHHPGVVGPTSAFLPPGIHFPGTGGGGALHIGGPNPLASATASKDIFSLYHLQMQGGPPFLGQRFPGEIL